MGGEDAAAGEHGGGARTLRRAAGGGARRRCLDPEVVGATLAALHLVALPAPEAIDDWYREPVGAADWDDLVGRLRRAGAADPAQELACSLFQFARTDPGRARALVAAYAAAGGPARLREQGDFSMLVAQLGHITQAAAEDWLTPSARSPRREDAEAWVRESLDDPHSRDRLTALLAATEHAQPSDADHA